MGRMVIEVAAPGTARSTQCETFFGNETCINRIFLYLIWHEHLSTSFSNSTKDFHSGFLKTKHKPLLVSCNSTKETVSIINNSLAKFLQEVRELHQLIVSKTHARLESKLLGSRDHQTAIRLQWSGSRGFPPQR